MTKRYEWKMSLSLEDRRQYDKHLKQLRQDHPREHWRVAHNKKYHEACKKRFYANKLYNRQVCKSNTE